MTTKNISSTEIVDLTDEKNQDTNSERTIYTINNQTIEEFSKNGLGLIVEATKCTNAMPSGTSRNLYSAHPAFGQVIEKHSEQILNIISKVLKKQQIKGNIQRRDHDEKVELMLECNDAMLERVNSNLDILAGIRKNLDTILIETELKTAPITDKLSNGSWNENRKILTATRGRTAKLLAARNIIRPQINFKIPVDNRSTTPFEPRLQYKPHSLKPLAILAEYGEDGTIESYLHPYEFELDRFTPPKEQLGTGKVCKSRKLTETPLEFIDTVDKLKCFIDELSEENEIAVDVEHHSYRTFQGITCLLQISTRQKDFIIDTLLLRDELHQLNEVFTNPKILKVFHGADSDIEWLQRDLSIYVVNMFDTHQAAKRLNFARLSLAFLLKHFCQIDADKSFQLADWRMRPLPDELIAYARQDTHYLLYIYDMLRQELLKKGNNHTNLLINVYQSSTELCKKRFVKPKITNESHLELYRKSKRIFDNRQLFALKQLFGWRDSIARMEDESFGYVLPNHMMLQISENLPREIQGILACCNPIPPLVRQHLHMLHKFILKAREQPLVKVVLDEQVTNRSVANFKFSDQTNPLYCPHDISSNFEFRDDLPTLLGSDTENHNFDENLNKKIKSPDLSVFGETNKKTFANLQTDKVKFVSPYSRYLAVLPFAEQQRLEEQQKEIEENRKRKLCPEAFITPTAVAINPSTSEKSTPEENPDNVPLKDLEKKHKRIADDSIADNDEPQQKKHKKNIDVDSIEAKINEIRQSVENGSQISKKDKKKNKNRTGNQPQSQQNEFDYSAVDFTKFQGGSKQHQKQQEIQTKYRGKGKNNKSNKQFNKLLQFGNVGKKK